MAFDEGRVPPAVLVDVLAYYDADDTIRMCDNFLEQRVFNMVPSALTELDKKSATGDGGDSPTTETDTNVLVHSFYVEWSLTGSGGGHRYPSLFNTPDFLGKLSVFLKRARVYVRLFGFVAVWHVRDMAGWLRRYLATTGDPAARAVLGLPFGVLEAHHFELRCNGGGGGLPYQQRLEALPVAPGGGGGGSLGKGVSVSVYNHALQLVPAPAARVAAATKRVEQNFANARLVSQSATAGELLLIPRSVFYDLHDTKRLLGESLVNRMDADFALAHPRMFLQTQTPANTALAVANASDQDLYEAATPLEAAQLQQMRSQRFTLAEAQRVLDHMRQRTSGSAPRDGESLRELRRQHFRRPDALDDAHTLPEFVTIAQAQPPAVLIDYDYQQHVYFEKVRQHMGLSNDTLIGEGGAATRNYGRSKRNNKERAASLAVGADGGDVTEKVEKIVARERDIYVAIFDFVYAAALAPYDWAAIGATADMIEDLIAASQWATAVGEAEDAASAARRILGEAEEEEEQQQKKKKKVAKKREKAAAVAEGEKELKVVAAELRAYMERARQQHRSLARLVFEPNQERKSQERVALLLELYELGLVEPNVLQTELRLVYGQHLQLREPPVEYLPGQVALLKRDLDEEEKAKDGPPKKKKRKE